ncbi:hypothetical protein FACS1894154_05430 [Betaproteobacteria bacterium]|nr:hypothetical protein FACS1894154_05430 [Betaproteobacteria bacterium]GHU24894.1 hypothetical protein FACS189488_10550 [Betaproteobacteria bacterium]
MRRVVDGADKKAEIERGGKQDEETENDFFKIHGGAEGRAIWMSDYRLNVGSLPWWQRISRAIARMLMS